MTKAEAAAAKQRCENATRSLVPGRIKKWMAMWPCQEDAISNARTDLPAALDMLERVMEFVSKAHELGCFIDDDDPDTTKLWHQADALVREWHGGRM